MLKLLLALGVQASAAGVKGNDPWLGADKLKHFLTSAFVQSVAYSTLRATGVRNGPALAGAAAVTLSVGAGKELWDRAGHGDPSLRDFTWDVLGVGAATVMLSRSR